MTDEKTALPILTPEMLDDDLGKMILAQALEASKTIGAAQKVIDAANADDAKLMVQNLRDSHAEWSKALEIMEKYNALVEKIDAENAPKVKVPSADDVEKATALIDVTRESAKPHVTFMAQAYGKTYDLSEIIPSNLSKKRGRKPGSTNGSTKRPRLANVHVRDTQNNILHTFSHANEGEDKATFSNLAKWLSKDAGTTVPVKDLQDHAFTVAGTQDLSTVSGTVEFGVTVGEKHYDIALESRQSE